MIVFRRRPGVPLSGRGREPLARHDPGRRGRAVVALALCAAALAALALPRAPSARGQAFPGQLGGRALAAAEQAALTHFIRLGLPLYCGGRRGRYAALTFDDGPGPYTPLALRILHAARARATFFLVGLNLSERPSLAREETMVGALGDHTWTHPHLPRLVHRVMVAELALTQRAIAAAAGMPVRLFRPPYGAHDAAVDAESHSLGLLEVLWSIDTRDSEGANWATIAANVSRAVRPGSIVLMHENHGQTIRALKFRILPELRRRGFRLVTLPELLALDPPTLAQLQAGPAGCRG